MPSATLTVREVKNKTTGIDITIPSYKEIPGMLGSTVEFDVVVVSRLVYFKSPKHKDSDVVQFMIPRKYPDFEHLYMKLSEQFAGTILPPLPKKVLRLTEAVIKDRKSKLENFLKFLACTPKLSTSPSLLQFLGVNAIKAGKYRKGEVDESGRKTDTEGKESDVGDDAVDSADPPETDLFGEAETVDDTDLFGAEEESDIFQSENTELEGDQAKLFEDQDFGGGLEEGQGDGLLLLPEARVTERTRDLTTGNIKEEDNSDLLKVEDDLDRFLVLDIQKSKKGDNTSDTNIDETSGDGSKKPELKPKPTLSKKPNIAQKPTVGSKPKIASNKPVLPRKPSEGANTESKVVVRGEETVPKKDNSSEPSPQETASDFGNDDILKYIQENAAGDDDEVDLFS